MKLFEAFEALDALNEETFTISDDGVEKLGAFMSDNNDVDDIVDVIDPEAETEEELKDSYVGKVILDCCVCHSKLYKDREDVALDEEGTLANVGEDCPFCYTSDGFKVVGEVAPFKDSSSEEEVVETKEEIKETEEVTESLTEAQAGTLERPLSKLTGTLSNVLEAHQNELAALTSKKDALSFLEKIEPEVKNKGYLATVKEKVTKLPDFKVLTFLYNIILKGDGMGSKLESLVESHRGDRHRVTAELFDILSENGFDTDAEDVEDYVFAARDLVFEEVLADPSKSIREIVEQWFEDTKLNYLEDLEALTRFEEGLFGIKTKKEKEKEAKAKAEKERQKQRDKVLKDQEERARQQSVADSWARNDRAKRDAQAEYNRSRYDGIKGDKPSNTTYRGVNYSGGDYYTESKSIKEDLKFNLFQDPYKGLESRISELDNSIQKARNEIDRLEKEKSKYQDSLSAEQHRQEVIKDFLNGIDIEVYYYNYIHQSKSLIVQTDYSEVTLKELKDTFSGSDVETDHNSYKKFVGEFKGHKVEVSYNESDGIIIKIRDFDDFTKSVNESKSIKEDINNLSLDTDDTHMEMSSDESGKVTITTEPIENTEVESEETIVPVSPELEAEIVEEPAEEATEEEVDIEEFDEASFDELGESYLKGLYENVEAFKTTNVLTNDSTLFVEGLITFTSGNAGKTSFEFSAKDFLKEGIYRFIGSNKELSEGKTNFELTGKITDKKFICESLTIKE